MTKQELAELFDSLYYGHDAELAISDKHYFLEWNGKGIEVYLMDETEWVKIISVDGKDRNDVVCNLFNLRWAENKNLNDFYNDIEIIDIE